MTGSAGGGLGVADGLVQLQFVPRLTRCRSLAARCAIGAWRRCGAAGRVIGT